jgi:hypothetical protein
MSDNQKNRADMRKTLTWATVAYGAFTALSVIGPIVLNKLWKRREK